MCILNMAFVILHTHLSIKIVLDIFDDFQVTCKLTMSDLGTVNKDPTGGKKFTLVPLTMHLSAENVAHGKWHKGSSTAHTHDLLASCILKCAVDSKLALDSIEDFCPG